ncbi:MAG: flagellar type III secretion system pore protein FliP [Gemmatimonadota bacterium]
MNAGALAGVLLTLALVLGLVVLALRLLRKATLPGYRLQQGEYRLEVIQRIGLGPRQGIALVRIADQVVAVSVGEGGVRPIADIDVGEAAGAEAPTPAAGRGFAPALLTRLRAAGIPLLLLAAVAMSGQLHSQQPRGSVVDSVGSAAQSPPAARPARVATVPTPNTQGGAALDRALNNALPTLDLAIDKRGTGAGEGLRLSGSVGIVIMLGLLTLLPTLVLMTTSFTRILIVLNFVKQAIGTQNAPPGQLIAALALILTGFVMAPTMDQMNRDAIAPWLDGQIEQGVMMEKAIEPMREFMLRQTRESDLATFVSLSRSAPPARPQEVSTIVLMSAFVTSELRTAFQLGFVLFLPFIVIDIVVSSVLMSMGMFMLPPAMISLPFKLLLFVLVDGWNLLIQSLVQGFR